MKKILRLLAVVAIILLNMMPMMVSAGATVVVVITATPLGGVQPPTPFTATVVTSTNVQLDWGYPVGTVVAMIRAKYGSPPLTMTDGYLVYQGAGITANDTSVNLDNGTDTIYYSAWGQDAGGVWSTNKNDTLQEVRGVIFAALLLGAIGLSGFTFRKGVPEPILGFMSAAIWFLWGAFSFTVMSTAVGDLYYWAGWFGMIGGLASGMLGAFAGRLKDKHVDEEPEETYFDETPRKSKKSVPQFTITQNVTSPPTAVMRRSSYDDAIFEGGFGTGEEPQIGERRQELRWRAAERRKNLHRKR